jgi:hypothetical protein
MNKEHIIQCKKAILGAKTSERDIKLSLSDKCQLRRITKKLRKQMKIEELSFEEFTLLCKHMKKDVLLFVESDYSTKIIRLLEFNINTLRYTLITLLHDIEINNDYNKYPKLDITLIKNNIINKQFITFEEFISYCKDIKVKIKID